MSEDKNIDEILKNYQNIIDNQRNKLCEIFKNDEFNIYPYNQNNINLNKNNKLLETSDTFNIIQNIENNNSQNKLLKSEEFEQNYSPIEEEEKLIPVNKEDKNINNMDGILISNNSKSRTNSKNKLNSKYEANYPLDSSNKDNIFIYNNNSNIKKNDNYTFSSNIKKLPIISKTQSKNNIINNMSKTYNNILKIKYNGKIDCVNLYYYYRNEWDKYNIIKEMEKKDLKTFKIINSNLKPEYQFI